MEEKSLYVINDEPAKKEEPAPAPAAPAEPAPAPVPVPAEPAPEEDGKKKHHKKEKKAKEPKPVNPSRFDCCGPAYYFLLIGCALLSTITIGIMYPWCLCWIAHYEAKHTYIDGKRLAFDGHGVQLIGHWILYAFLFVITATIFGFWIPKKLKNWKAGHTHFAAE